VIATKESLRSYLDAFEQFQKRAAVPEWLQELRREAFARFWELGFPTLKDEDWRFTNLAPITTSEFSLAGSATFDASSLVSVIPTWAGVRLVFVNGRFSPELSALGDLGRGVVAMSLAEAIAASHPVLKEHLAKHEDFRGEAFTALNTAFLQDGAFVLVKRGVVLEKPIYVLYVSTSDGAQMVHPRNLFVAEEQSQATFVEDYASLPSWTGPAARDGGATTAFFSNVVTEVVAGADSIVSHFMIEREDAEALNISTLRVQQARNANVDSHSVLVGGALVRNNVHPVLAGDGADCLINGLFIANGRQHMDNYMKVEHASPHCNSRQFYNGILDGHSRGVFHGRIIVHKDAQKTDAKQTNRNLLLSNDAQIDTKPQLEIFADDVKCTHGATIGQMDEEALFYMRSRGIPDAEARQLMLFAFASECLDRMKPGVVREWLETMVPQWLPEGASR
jgi:Fe-S cluster assembly protein SufD